MKINQLSLENYRNFKNLNLDLSERVLIVGDNGVGKSNLLEAAYLLASGHTKRAETEKEVILVGLDYAKIRAQVRLEGEDYLLDLTLNLGGQDRVSKAGSVNNVKKGFSQFFGFLKAVEFSPEDINLVLGSPDLRRRYLNSVLNQASLEYRQNFKLYERTRKEKNALLFQIKEGSDKREDLDLWNEQIANFGFIVNKIRDEYLKFLTDNTHDLVFEYSPSEISLKRLREFEEREIAAGVSLIGPHRDDFRFLTKASKTQLENLAKFGSRGQERLAVFELKIGEINYFRKRLKVEPILLLDDVFSELDKEHRHGVFKRLELEKSEQVIFTATSAENLEEIDFKDVKKIEL